jgi:pyrimidine deaminase RibD-like protein
MTDPTAEKDRLRLTEAARLARLCPPSDKAFSVGAVIFDAAGQALSRGHSRESDPVVHAEEAALAKLDPRDERLRSATLYSSLEPCSERASRPWSCTQLILNAGIPRVVVAWREPNTFVADCQGVDILKEHGVEVLDMPELARLAMEPNSHLLRIEKGP